jgi:cell wall-associated NlpC family hydrolase
VASTRFARLNRALIGFAILGSALVVSPLAAHAVPLRDAPTAPKTSGEVVTSLARLAEANEKLAEQFNKAQIDVDQAQKDAAAAAAAAAAAQQHLVVARQALATSLASQYKSAAFSRTAALLAANSGQSYLETMQSLNILAVHQGEIAKTATVAASTAKDAQATANRLVTATVDKRSSLEKQRSAIQVDIDKQKKLLASLTAAERARFIAATAPPANAAQVAAVPAVQQAAPTATAAPAQSKGAGAAVQAALSQLGKPYVWGAAGPGSFDCSGLTMWAWAQAGVNLPHQSAEQQGLGTSVAQSQLQPGDLVFFGSPAYHVGLYIGNGMMVHAPTTGDVVKVTALAYMSDYSGATRVG